ncbi:hypothetical protein BDV95DRAFT_498652 [Massariosphaeria phaeospora]|uniref:NAD(P)-binding protein n=1 Tax=Massariosphaeria phaeospora TaxID=100035 RepID=A0A7C8MKN9_9PLEO|nr:hypothetical protein BDV95DRAFT_498652 [Massariosphaeria phaeospora]
MAHTDRLTSSRILIFGGTSGIGFAVANLALSHSATVLISGSSQPKAAAKAALLHSFYPSLPASAISAHALDLLDTDNLETGLKALLDTATQHGREKLDHVVWTAGDALAQPKLQDVTFDAAVHGYKVRVLAPLALAKLLAAHPGVYMPRAATSSLTLTGGTNTAKPFPGWTMAAVWGGSVDGLARGLAVDLAPVRVNVVEPGAIRTELLEGLLGGMGEERAREMERGIGLLGEFGRPEDTAEAYAWLMRDRFVTGSAVSTDGGRLLAGAGI